MKRLFSAAACVAMLAMGAMALYAAPVLADTATSVTLPTTDVVVPWGNWIGESIAVVESILGVVLTFALTIAARHLPAALSAFVTDKRIGEVETLLEHAIDYALNMAAVAAKDRTADINVRSQTVAVAAQYAIDHGPGHLVDWMGGEKGITQKIIARLPVSTLVPTPIAVPVAPAASGA